ncbi:unnamed protein product [Clonostachys chloroleuca]|uniref:Dihydrodipicolinate synthase n=1 Tax=Clonostachys chloroleuca TaxID=1926264 RepID=A0AA35LQ18_9HYPO|nr:unnamed protein product [Clonostachys chloroleuca]
MPPQRQLWPDGPAAPVTTPFLPGGHDIDHDSLAANVKRNAAAGLHIVILGTTGEASHLLRDERKAAIATARRALDQAGYDNAPLLAGTGGSSLQATIDLTRDAAQAGATHALVIIPGYFSYAMKEDRTAIRMFFQQVMDASPLPVMLYNFPGAAAGIDMNSDDISFLADHPNCFGVKLTCASIGKGIRICSYTQSPEYLAKKGSSLRESTVSGRFLTLTGLSDYLLPALAVGHAGCIASSGGVFPKTLRRLYDTSVAGLNGDIQALNEAKELQNRVARSDAIVCGSGIQGTKFVLDRFVAPRLGGDWRLPLGPLKEETKQALIERLIDDWKYEESL